MNDHDSRRLFRLLLVYLGILVVISGAVAYLSLNVANLKSVQASTTERTATNSSDIQYVEDRISKLEQAIKTIPIPKNGKDGKDGNDSVSSTKVIEKQIIKEVPVNGKDGKDGRDGKDGEDGRPVILCKLGESIGWAYVGANLCNPVEVLQ
jgi:uncharacterized protein (UPF0333 family)